MNLLGSACFDVYRPDQPYLAFSPDEIAVVSNCGSLVFAVFEYKTRTKAQTVEKEVAIATKHGNFATIVINNGLDGERFRELIPDQAHRAQVLHNLIASSLTHGFLVYASKTTIIRVVHVVAGEDVVDAYLLGLASVKNQCLDWIYSPDISVPKFSTEELGHCGDMSTLHQHLNLWKALNDMVERRGRPLPPARHIIPTVIAKWNRVKGGIDVYSRYLKNVGARHLHLAPLGAIWLRMFMTLIYNAYQTTQLLRVSFYLFILLLKVGISCLHLLQCECC